MTEKNPAQIYEEYMGPAIFQPLSRALLDLAQPAQGDKVLDVACGTGIVTRQLVKLVGATGKVVGLDINPAMLAVAGAIAPSHIEWRQASGTETGLPDGSYDLALCQQGLQFFPDRAAGVREMRRVLGAGGRAVVAVWKGIEHQPVFRALMQAEAQHLGIDAKAATVPFSLGDGETLQRLFGEAGFARVALHAHTVTARFPDPGRFIRQTVMAAVAVIPSFSELSQADIDQAIAGITADMAGVIAEYRQGDDLVFPLPTHLIAAHV